MAYAGNGGMSCGSGGAACCLPSGGARIVRVSIPGIQGPPGEAGSSGFSCRTCRSLEAGQTEKLLNLRPNIGAKEGDTVLNASGQLFQITAVTETTFTVGEVVGTVGVVIDDEATSPDSVWSSAKIAARLGEPIDFVKIFELKLAKNNAGENSSS